MPEPGTAAVLWGANDDLARAALEHEFVRRTADGTLPRAAFARFIAQDAYFLEAFARAYALASARSPDPATASAFAELIAGVREELSLHGAYARQWGIDMQQVTPLPATLAYTGFLLATADTAGIDVICAAMTPCMRLYAHLGQSLDGSASGPYREWVSTYAQPQFEQLAATLERLLDEHLVDAVAAARAYRTAMQLELEFFDAALQP